MTITSALCSSCETNRKLSVLLKTRETTAILSYFLSLPWLFLRTSCVALAHPSRPQPQLHQHRTAGHDWPLLDGHDVCLSRQSARPKGPSAQQDAPLRQTVSRHLPGSESFHVCGCHRCEAGAPGSPSVMSDSETESVHFD